MAEVGKSAMDKGRIGQFPTVVAKTIEAAFQELRILHGALVRHRAVHIDAFHDDATLQRIGEVDGVVALDDGRFVGLEGVGADAHAGTAQRHRLADVDGIELAGRERDDVAIGGGFQSRLQGRCPIVGTNLSVVAERGKERTLGETHGGEDEGHQRKECFLHSIKNWAELLEAFPHLRHRQTPYTKKSTNSSRP